MKEDIKLRLPVVPELDKRGTSKLIRDVKGLENQLGKVGISYKELAKVSQANVKELKHLSDASRAFAAGLTKATKSSVKELEGLGKQLEDAHKAAQQLESEYGAAKSGKEKAEIKKRHDAAVKSISTLTKQVDSFTSANKRNLKDMAQAMAKFEKQAEFKGSDAFKGMASGISQMFKKGGLMSGLKTAGGAAGQGVAGVAARSSMASMASGGEAGGMASAIQALSKAGPAIGATAAALMAFIELLKAASNHMTHLNKVLIEGTGSANDFVSNSQHYADSLNDLRSAAIGAAGSMLKYGMNSEGMLKTINAYAKESTGSLIDTRNAMKMIGKGSTQMGLEHFAESALIYGKALGMQADETGALMGKFQQEIGYGFDQVEGVMDNVVTAAANANIPMTKFMGIFHSVIPDMELYQNRIEELTGTIRLLSKTMSAKDIKNFENAFSKGFQGVDFKQRLKTMFIAGEKNVSGALQKDFQAKANVIGKSLQNYMDPADFQKAFEKGPEAMAAALADAQAAASKKGQQLSGTDISNAMKLASNEQARKKGGLDLVTAMSGGGQLATYKILKEQSQAFTKGFTGLAEHVIKATGINEQQYEALRTMDQSIQQQKAVLSKYGKTNSKSMNKALREQIMMRKDRKAGAVTDKEMASATDDELFAASEAANADKDAQKTREKAQNLAAMQYEVTTSIGDKIDNYIGYLLEKIYNVLNDEILGALDKAFNWLIGGDKGKGFQKKHDQDKSGALTDIPGADKFVSEVTKSISDGLDAGLSSDDLADNLAKNSGIAEVLDETSTYGASADTYKFLKGEFGMDDRSAEPVAEAIFQAQKKNDKGGMLKALQDLPGDFEDNVLKFMRYQAAGLKAPGAGGAAGDPYHRANKLPGAAKYLSPEDQAASVEKGDIEDLTSKVDELQPSAASAAGQPDSAAMPVSVVGPSVVAQEKHADVAEEHKEIAEKAANANQDTADKLDKGITFNQSWMNTKFKNVLKEASLESFRKALKENLVLQAKMDTDSGFKQLLAGGQGWNFAESGQDVSDTVMGAQSGEIVDALHKLNPQAYATGGPVDYDQLAKIHSGEYVVPKNGALVMGGGSGGGGGGGGGGKVINIQGVHIENHGDGKSVENRLYELHNKGGAT